MPARAGTCPPRPRAAPPRPQVQRPSRSLFRSAGASAIARRQWPSPWRWAAWGAAALGGLGGLAFLAGELSGWRLLAQPAEAWLSQRLARPVSLGSQQPDGFRLRLWGGVRLRSAAVRIDAPAWAGPAPLVQAQQVELRARWSDLLRWRPGTPLPLASVVADRLDAQLLRRADGRASWQQPGTPAPADPSGAEVDLPVSVDLLWARDGRVQFSDAVTRTEIDLRFALRAANAAGAAAGGAPPHDGLRATAVGSYRGLPLRGELRTGSLRPLIAGQPGSQPATAVDLGVVLALSVGRASLGFDGVVRDPLRQRDLLGRFTLAGPSLAAVGQPLGITLPTTARFDMRGQLARTGAVWSALVQQAHIGQSRLDGEFQYDTRPTPLPRLAGRLHATTLALADLGPAIGTPTGDRPAQVRAPGRVLPDHRFDLPSLRSMQANVQLQISRLDFGTSALQSVAPLNGHLTLRDGVLRLDALDATMAQGSVSGLVELDGRGDQARWQARLAGRGLRLEQWIRPVQRGSQPPYASGLLGATLQLTGTGRSTAELLASADGRLALQWTEGQISHLLVEAAGLDIAQGLGVLLRGDKPLPVHCGLADLAVHDGTVTPRAFVVDTSDSRLWLTGSLSLASERLSLLARVEPKDMSPLALRAPLHIDGTLAAPQLRLDGKALARRALPAALLALAHPLAALIPLFDAGEPAPAQRCAALLAALNAPRSASGAPSPVGAASGPARPVPLRAPGSP